MVADTTMDSMYLENLDEFINDEGKIVTYKWLSLTLGVHTNVAKQMLYHFVTSQRDSDKGDDLSVTYFVSGVVAGEEDHPDVHKVILVREDNLATVKSKMKDVISVHIYSVQKTKLHDMSVLYTANYDQVKENIMSINRYSSIECPEVKVRSSADLAKIKQENAYQAPPEPTKIESKYKPSQMKTNVKQEPSSETEAKHMIGSSKTAGKSNQIASMFARQTKKLDDIKTEAVKSEKISKKGSSPAGSKTKGGISAFFKKEPVENSQTSESANSSSSCKTSDSKTKSSKCSSIKSDSATSSPVNAESAVSSPSKKECQKAVKESQPESMDIDISSKRAKRQQTIQVKKERQQRGKNKRKEEKNDPAPKTKRKRIMQLSDSESSSEEEEEEAPACPPSPPAQDCVRVESDSDEEIPTTPQPKSLDLLNRGRARKKIQVDKTYIGEDGFLVTNKVFEYIHVDEPGDEETSLPKKEQDPLEKMETSPKVKKDISPKTKHSPQKKSAKATKKSQVADAKKKQPNITNFFQRK
nr:DNA polymerase delta subunit 3-like isoform X2 [Procambarus clarkii]